jgi:hypothetical protein
MGGEKKRPCCEPAMKEDGYVHVVLYPYFRRTDEQTAATTIKNVHF